MNLLWGYDDFVKHLGHANPLVRRWAFDALDRRFANRCTPEVGNLLFDEDELLACAAVRSLALKGVVQQAPAILEAFKTRRGLVAHNCALALGDLGYEPAAEAIAETLATTEDPELFLSMVPFLGKVRSEEHHESLASLLEQMEDPFILGQIAEGLLSYRRPEDLGRVLERFVKTFDPGNPDFTMLPGLSNALGGAFYLRDFLNFERQSILEKPLRTLQEMLAGHPHLKLEKALTEDLVRFIAKRQYLDVLHVVAADAARVVAERYARFGSPSWLHQLAEQDATGLAALEDFGRHSLFRKKVQDSQKFSRQLVCLVLSVYFAIKERGAYPAALSPEAGVPELIKAVENAGPELPEEIRKRVIASSPAAALQEVLTAERQSWGDIWAVRLMGQIGNKEFAPELIQTLSISDSLQFVYSDAIDAIHALDESADESILEALRAEAVDDWASFAILEQLPYAEAYDQAVLRWDRGEEGFGEKMDSVELFSDCLRQIGDPRGIEKLRAIYTYESTATYIGDALDCLSALHRRELPELPEITRKRKEGERRLRAGQDWLKEPGPAVRPAPKVGRNQPCPCGSGKKYKKCCLGEVQGPAHPTP